MRRDMAVVRYKSETPLSGLPTNCQLEASNRKDCGVYRACRRGQVLHEPSIAQKHICVGRSKTPSTLQIKRELRPDLQERSREKVFIRLTWNPPPASFAWRDASSIGKS